MSIDPSKVFGEMVGASFDASNRKIEALETENAKLKRENRDLKNKLSSAHRSINRRDRDDYERVDMGDYER